MDLARDEETRVRNLGRLALEKAAKAGASKAGSNGISRTFATVSRVNGDGTIDVSMGDYTDVNGITSECILRGLRMTVACSGAQVGDRVIVDTYAHVSVVTGILANADNTHYVKKDGWYITHLAGLTIATTTLVGTATNFITTGTNTNLYKNLGATNYPVTFKEIPVTVVCPDGTVLKADTVGNSTTKFETRIMFDGTTGWMGSRVPYRVSVITIGIV